MSASNATQHVYTQHTIFSIQHATCATHGSGAESDEPMPHRCTLVTLTHSLAVLAGSGRWPIGCGPRTEGCCGRSIALANGNVRLDGKRRSEQGRSTFNPCRFAWTRRAKRRGLSTSGSLTTSRADFHKLLTSTTSCYMHRVPERCLSIRIIDDCLPSEWICTLPRCTRVRVYMLAQH